MTEISFSVPVVPMSQPRQRHRIAKNDAGKQYVRNYTSERAPIQTFKATVRMAAQQAYQGPPLEGPLRCDLEFVFPRPSGLIWKTKPMPRLPHSKRPDRDNLDKAVMDALKSLLWLDDAQVCDGRIQKWIAAGNEQPHVVITVSCFYPSPTAG